MRKTLLLIYSSFLVCASQHKNPLQLPAAAAPEMVRPYSVKWLKKQKKRRKAESSESNPPPVEEEEGEEEQNHEEEEEVDKKKRKKPTTITSSMVEEEKGNELTKVEEEEEEEAPTQILPGLPMAPCDEGPKPGVIFILERASLRVGKVGKKEHILSGDEHANFLRKMNLNPADFRPDIVHQALLSILDRPLTKAGRLVALYVKTDDGELFEVKPYVRLPRTFKRFIGLMYQLKSEKRIHASGKCENLFRMIKNPVTRHLPVNSRKIGFSYSSEKLVKMRDYVAAASDDVPLVFVVGAMAHGKIEADYTDDFVSVSGYQLSAACCISRVCEALEQKWNII